MEFQFISSTKENEPRKSAEHPASHSGRVWRTGGGRGGGLSVSRKMQVLQLQVYLL